jgi:hypothetical protein
VEEELLQSLRDERMREQLRRRRSLEMVKNEGLVEEVLGGGGDIGGKNRSTGGADLTGKTGLGQRGRTERKRKRSRAGRGKQ